MSEPRCTESPNAGAVMHQAGCLIILDGGEHHQQVCAWCGALLMNMTGGGLIGRATPVGAWLLLDADSGTVRVVEPWGGEMEPVSVTGLPHVGTGRDVQHG